MIETAPARIPARLPLSLLVEQARGQGSHDGGLDLETPIDRGRHFVCPASTPLYYTAAHDRLTAEQARRYNQIAAMAFNEIIQLFEGEMGFRILPALARLPGASPDLIEYLRIFEEEERRHLEMWRALNRLSEPGWYGNGGGRFVRLSPPVLGALRWSCRRPGRFPFLLWIMLLQEERAIEVGRRSLRLGLERIEPRYAEAYRRHLLDEVRHVQVDWHLIERFHGARGRAARRLNAAILRFLVREFLLAPSRVGIRTVRQLAAEFPELRPELPEMERQLRGLASNRDYQEMMYSRRSHPIAFSLFDRYPELHGMSAVLAGYRAAAQGDEP